MKPTVKAFHDDIGLLNEVNKLTSDGVSKDRLYIIGHDDDRTDCVVGDTDAQPDDVSDLVAERYNGKGEELRALLQSFGLDSDESGDLQEKLDGGELLLLIR